MTEYDWRAAEYVDSPLIRHRLRYKRQLAVLIEGRYGRYRTEDSVAGGAGSCTCPSDERPCKHVRALRLTWRANPESFFDLGAFLAELSRRPKVSLVAALAKAVQAQPSCLSALGVQGFESHDEPDEQRGVATPEEPRAVIGARRLTPRQGQYLAFIHYYQKIHGRAPAEADLQRHFRVSPPSVHRMLVTMHRRGLIARVPGKARSVRVLVSPDELPDLR